MDQLLGLFDLKMKLVGMSCTLFYLELTKLVWVGLIAQYTVQLWQHRGFFERGLQDLVFFSHPLPPKSSVGQSRRCQERCNSAPGSGAQGGSCVELGLLPLGKHQHLECSFAKSQKNREILWSTKLNWFEVSNDMEHSAPEKQEQVVQLPAALFSSSHQTSCFILKWFFQPQVEDRSFVCWACHGFLSPGKCWDSPNRSSVFWKHQQRFCSWRCMELFSWSRVMINSNLLWCEGLLA